MSRLNWEFINVIIQTTDVLLYTECALQQLVEFVDIILNFTAELRTTTAWQNSASPTSLKA